MLEGWNKELDYVDCGTCKNEHKEPCKSCGHNIFCDEEYLFFNAKDNYEPKD